MQSQEGNLPHLYLGPVFLDTVDDILQRKNHDFECYECPQEVFGSSPHQIDLALGLFCRKSGASGFYAHQDDLHSRHEE